MVVTKAYTMSTQTHQQEDVTDAMRQDTRKETALRPVIQTTRNSDPRSNVTHATSLATLVAIAPTIPATNHTATQDHTTTTTTITAITPDHKTVTTTTTATTTPDKTPITTATITTAPEHTTTTTATITPDRKTTTTNRINPLTTTTAPAPWVRQTRKQKQKIAHAAQREAETQITTTHRVSTESNAEFVTSGDMPKATANQNTWTHPQEIAAPAQFAARMPKDTTKEPVP